MRFLLLSLTLLAVAAPTANAYPKLPVPLPPVKHNPADQLADLPIEDSVYDGAAKCKNRRNAGVTALSDWLGANIRGVFWGSYRCEKWGKNSASLHAENRAIDWHLDAFDKADRRAADKLIRLLLAPDRLGNPQALARRMGVEELIWDCGQALRPHGRAPGPHPHRDDQGRRQGPDELLDGRLRSCLAEDAILAGCGGALF
jgi:hypothetical protein